MPLYEYRCEKCGKVVEKIQRFSDAPLKTCEFCGGKLERLVSSSAIQFKGSGWYITDYSKKASPSEPPKPSATTTTASETKKAPEPAPAKTPSNSK